MYTLRTRNFISFLIAMIIFFGLIAGIIVGRSLMGPTADAIEGALKYPELYEDELLERHWTSTCTIAMLVVWLASALVATYFHIKSLSLEMLEDLVVLTKKQTQSDDE
jgi:hypothetical protein